MGLNVLTSYTTDQGFVISMLYLSIRYYTIRTQFNTRKLECTFKISAYKSYQDRETGAQTINLPYELSVINATILPIEFYRQSFFGVAYSIVKSRWNTQGYATADVLEPGQPSATQYIYDASGYNIDGINSLGVSRGPYAPSMLKFPPRHKYVKQAGS